MLKKMMLLAMSVGALMAFAAPAAQAADEFFTDVGGNPVTIGLGTANADDVTFTGSLSTTKFPIVNGPCAVSATVDLWNEAFEVEEEAFAEGTGEVTSFTITGGCPVSTETAGGVLTPVPGCEIEKATSEAFPWHVDLQANTKIDITGANFKNFYKGCGALGIPSGVGIGASGTSTGQWVNGANKGCIVFNKSGDLKNPANEEVTVSGEVCAPNVTLLGN